MLVRNAVLCAVAMLSATGLHAQSRDAWLMQNYRFTGPPAAMETGPVDPAIAALTDIQNTTLAILRKADFAGDYEAALAAAAQAAANVQLMAMLTGRIAPPAARKTTLSIPSQARPAPPQPLRRAATPPVLAASGVR